MRFPAFKYIVVGVLWLLSVFQKDHALSAQAWNAACSGANYCDIGTIVPTSAIQTVPSSSFCAVMGGSSHSNNFNAGSSKFIKLQFAATAGQKYCFSLRTFGSVTNNGSGIEIISTACPTGSSYVATSYTAYGTQYSQMRNCLAWTAPATQTYYIQLSGGTCGCNFFGCCGSTGFETEAVDFSYATSASGSGSCSCASGVLLPIDLVQFKAIQNKEGILIEWATASETNNKYFTVERSMDGNYFIPIAKINGAGTSYIAKQYSTLDREPNRGINYYRLKQTDYNGESSYSAIVSVTRLDTDKWLGDVYPNPAENETFFEIYSGAEATALVELTDLTGRVVYSQTAHVTEGTQTLAIATADLAKGLYSLRVSLENGRLVSVKKLVKN